MSSFQSEIDFYRKEYAKQKKLEQFVCQRQLNRPNTKKWFVITLFCFIPILLFCAVFSSIFLPLSTIYKLLYFALCFLLIFELYLRFCLIQTVKCYQRYANEETRKRCMCVPSCSEYAIICLKKVFPLFLALVKIRKRLYKTCKGQEYKLDFPLKKMNSEFEKKYLN